MKFQKWKAGTPDPAVVFDLEDAGYPTLLASVLAVRGIRTAEEAAGVLERKTGLTLSPLLMRDMDKAVARIRRAVEQRETVAVFGDYDVDGITSTVILSDYLKRQGLVCLRHIPRRVEEGYGLSNDAIRSLREQGASLMITVDCGITGNREVEYANSIGLDVVITDHHECKEELPPAVAVVDPHRPDCPYPFKHLAGCGVALNLVMALGGPEEADALFVRYRTLAAIGTVADVMRMEGENRTIVFQGLEDLPNTPFAGVHALLKEIGLSGKPVSSTQIGFVFSPRINAAGRMGQVDLAVDLLETSDPARAEELAKALCALNRERQSVEQAIFADAESRIQKLPPDQRAALVLASDQWHQGVVGIVASRLSEKYARPSFMIHLRDGVGKGSCRSVAGFNLFDALSPCADLLDGFGGHALAAGFTIPEENIPAFRERVNQCVREKFGDSRPVSTLEADLAVTSASDLTLEQAQALEILEPYGTGNLRPVFVLPGVVAEGLQNVGQGRHLKLRLSKGSARFDAIFFSMSEETSGIRAGMRVDAAFYVQPNTFRGVTTLQLQLIDIRPSLFPSRPEEDAFSLVRRLTAGEPISAPEAARLNAPRSHFIACWRALEPLLAGDGTTADGLPFLRDLAAKIGGEEAFLRVVLALEVFQERRLLAMEWNEESLSLTRSPFKRKVDLFACPWLAQIRESLS